MRQPDIVVWLTTAWPHAVVKMEGAIEPPGTSRSVMEVVELDPGTGTAILAGGSAPRPATP